MSGLRVKVSAQEQHTPTHRRRKILAGTKDNDRDLASFPSFVADFKAGNEILTYNFRDTNYLKTFFGDK